MGMPNVIFPLDTAGNLLKIILLLKIEVLVGQQTWLCSDTTDGQK